VGSSRTALVCRTAPRVEHSGRTVVHNRPPAKIEAVISPSLVPSISATTRRSRRSIAAGPTCSSALRSAGLRMLARVVFVAPRCPCDRRDAWPDALLASDIARSHAAVAARGRGSGRAITRSTSACHAHQSSVAISRT
jgi:hypothetical protein